jgi:hypothetical protein
MDRDLVVRCSKIANALAVAFGGISQVGELDIARAIAGQFNNNGLAWWTMKEVVREILIQMDDDGDWYDDEAVLNTAEARLRELQAKKEDA